MKLTNSFKGLFETSSSDMTPEIFNAQLSHLHKMLISKTIPKELASAIMSEKDDFHEQIERLKDMAMAEKKFSAIDQQNLYLLIVITQYLYNYSGLNTGISDSDYDILYEAYINLGNEDIISVDLPFDTKETAEHKYPSLRGTLTKIYYLYDNETRKNPTRKYLSEWISSREREILDKSGKHVNLREEYVYVFPKWDGVSCIFQFKPDGSLDLALTRGNVYTNVAQNITKQFPKMRGKETKNGYGLKTEIMMREEDLEYFNTKYGESYKNTRSVVSSILNSDNLDERNDLLVIQKLRDSTIENGEETLQVLDDGAFESPFIRCKLGDTDQIKKFAEEHRYVNGLRCDGAVIYIINEELRKILGREDNKNKYEVAYKFTEEATLTTLEDVIFQVGQLGAIAPVAKIKPVKLKGNTIQRISLGSISRFHDLELRKGDTVKILYDVIPYLIFDSDCEHNDGKKIKAPKTCPCCGEELMKNSDGYYANCVNPECSWIKKGRILNYVQKLGISNISYETIDRLYDENYLRSIDDLYLLRNHIEAISKLDGFGETSIKNIITSIEEHARISDYEFLGSLGISGCSIKTFKEVLKVFPIDQLLSIASEYEYEKLTKIPGIKNKKAKKIVEGLQSNMGMIQRLSKHMTIYHPMTSENERFSVTFTKVRDKDTEKEIEKRGGIIDDPMKKTTNYLVVPNLAVQSKKVEAAKKNGIQIVPIDDILEVLDRDLERGLI